MVIGYGYNQLFLFKFCNVIYHKMAFMCMYMGIYFEKSVITLVLTCLYGQFDLYNKINGKLANFKCK